MELFNRRHPGLIYKASFLFAFIAVFTFLALKLPQNSQAASLANFHPGNIISDYVMSNYSTMSISDIDAFLHSHGNCSDTNITKASWYPSLHYHIEDGHFVCLADEHFSASGANYGDLLEEDEESQTAAEIIHEVAQDYKINPQVLLVLLEKEQGLISDSWPNSIQYRSATGFGCPDTAPCDSEYYGLKNQLESAAWLFRTVLDGGWTNYPLGENFIYYNPNRACGGSVVNIENLATSALYRYTPYQPNQGALDAGYGTVTCGAYGNRNFYLFFMDWFGDPTITNNEPTVEEILANVKKIDDVESELNLEYRTHIQDIGWLDWSEGGEMSGTTGFSLRIEALEAKFADDAKGIEYNARVIGQDWGTTYQKDGEQAGTTGQSLPIESIRFRLYGELAEKYDIAYRTHVQNIGWTDWSENDIPSGAPEGESLRIEAIQIKIIKKPIREASLDYRAHVQNIGWQDWVKNGELAGTSGQSLRLEALEIKLDETLAKDYDIYYRAHVQNIGWQDWVKNGELAGTSGQSLRLEALEIKLSAKLTTNP